MSAYRILQRLPPARSWCTHWIMIMSCIPTQRDAGQRRRAQHDTGSGSHRTERHRCF